MPTENTNKNPSGAKMLKRTEKVKDRVRRILLQFPATKGDDTLLTYRYLREFHPQVRLTFAQFEALLYIPAFETIRRRRQELQAEVPDLRPTERVIRKRKRNEEATHNYYGKKMDLTLTDFNGDE